jgi:hypothetical protein
MPHRIPRRKAVATAAIVGLVAIATARMPAQADALPPPGTVSVIGQLPDFATAADTIIDTGGGGDAVSPNTFLVADPVHRVLVEMNDYVLGQGNACKGSSTTYLGSVWTSYDIDTYQPIAVGCDLPSVNGQFGFSNGNTTTLTAVVVDPTSGLILAPCLSCDGNADDIYAVSTTTLHIVAKICVALESNVSYPSGCVQPDGITDASKAPYTHLRGLSWYAPDNDLVVLTDNFGAPGSPPQGQPGVAVSDYHLVDDGSGHIHVLLRWTAYVSGPSCVRSLLDTQDWTGVAYRSEAPGDPALFVPCTSSLGVSAGIQPNQATVIEKIRLNQDGTLPANAATTATVTVAPFNGQSVIFDPAGERGYLIPVNPNNGFTMAVYDGRSASFLGRLQVASGPGQAMFGVDPATGRMYAGESGTGIRLVEGRRTPPAIISPVPPAGISAVGRGYGTNVAVAPPDAAHPYQRIFLPLLTDQGPGRTDNGQLRKYMKYFTVLGDRIGATQDPPPTQVDEGTHPGAPGVPVSVVSYGANAAGYGVHADLVGGYWGAFMNNVPESDAAYQNGLAPPFGLKTLDVAAGAVGRAALVDGSAQVNASSLYDLGGSGTQGYRSCSDVLSPQSCAPPPPGLLPDLPSAPQSTAQQWPYPVAECSKPGEGADSQRVSGTTTTPPHSTDPSATPAPPSGVPASGLTSGASAFADCSAGQASGTGRYQCASGSVSASQDPAASSCDPKPGQLGIASVETDTKVQPPKDGITTSTVTASVHGIHLDLGTGVAVDIQGVVQTVTASAGGRPGTATTQRSVLISGVTVTQAGQPPHLLCVANPCQGDGQLLDTLNSVDPSHFYVLLPTPDEPFGVAGDHMSPRGSPGGYQATVQSSRAEQQGDKQWNGMTGFSGSEKDLLPALRIVLYDPGEAQVHRLILDFAGVEADAHLGLQSASDSGGTFDTTTVEATQAMVEAGIPPTSMFIPGTLGTPRIVGQSKPPASHSGGGPLGILERTLDGISWLVRSPFGGVQMAAFLTLLGVPLLLSRRRWVGRIPSQREG